MNRSEVNFAFLLILLKANSKEQVLKICQIAVARRRPVEECKFEDEILDEDEIKALGVDKTASKELLTALGDLIGIAIYRGLTESSKICELFPVNFHANLRELVSNILAENCPKWQSEILNNQVTTPRLIDFDWCVDNKNSGVSITPTCLLHLQVENTVSTVDEISIELTRESLKTMLDGMGKIKDQINSLTK